MEETGRKEGHRFLSPTTLEIEYTEHESPLAIEHTESLTRGLKGTRANGVEGSKVTSGSVHSPRSSLC